MKKKSSKSYILNLPKTYNFFYQKPTKVFDIYISDFWKFQKAIINRYISVYTICCIASAIAFLGLEFWKTDFWVSKKTVVRRLQVHLSVSQSKTVNLFQPRKFRFILCRRIIQLLLCFLIMINFI